MQISGYYYHDESFNNVDSRELSRLGIDEVMTVFAEQPEKSLTKI